MQYYTMHLVLQQHDVPIPFPPRRLANRSCVLRSPLFPRRSTAVRASFMPLVPTTIISLSVQYYRMFPGVQQPRRSHPEVQDPPLASDNESLITSYPLRRLSAPTRNPLFPRRLFLPP